MRLLRVTVIIFFLVSIHAPLHAQERRATADSTRKIPFEAIANKAAVVTIGDIHISGNKRTKNFIILRELPFKKGESYTESELENQLVLAKQQLINTTLFVDLTVYVSARNGDIADINVDLKERWYFFPMPYFKLVDRNFNQWWVEQNRSLDRINYGIKFTQNNFSGRNDTLDIWLIAGYTQQLSLRYNLPFFDKQLKSGFNIGFLF